MCMKKSAGILLYQEEGDELRLLLVHPGGPFWKNKDVGAWSIPKGEFTDEEDPLAAAKREFQEETGMAIDGTFISLPPVKQNSNKMIYAFALEASFDTTVINSNLFDIEWPPRSGKTLTIPEVDKAEWFPENIARTKIIPGQVPLIDGLKKVLELRQQKN